MNHTIILKISEIAELAHQYADEASARHQYGRAADLEIIRDRLEELMIDLEGEERRYADWVADMDAQLFGDLPMRRDEAA